MVIKIQLPHLHGENFVFEIWFWKLKINKILRSLRKQSKFSNHILMFQIFIYFNATKFWSSYGSRTHVYLVTLVPQNYLTKCISIAIGLRFLPLHKNYYFDQIDPMLILNQCNVGLNQNWCNMTRPMLITVCPYGSYL